MQELPNTHLDLICSWLMKIMQWYSKTLHASCKKALLCPDTSSLRNKPVTFWPELHRPEVTSLMVLQKTRAVVSESILTLDCFSSSSDWARLTWSKKTGLFYQHLSEDLLTSPSIFLFEVCHITDIGPLLGLLQLRFWMFFCLISSMEKPSHARALPQKAFIEQEMNK